MTWPEVAIVVKLVAAALLVIAAWRLMPRKSVEREEKEGRDKDGRL